MHVLMRVLMHVLMHVLMRVYYNQLYLCCRAGLVHFPDYLIAVITCAYMFVLQFSVQYRCLHYYYYYKYCSALY